MKLTTKREELVSKLSIVSRAVSTRAATQALSGILLTAAEGGVDALAPPTSRWACETTLDAEVAERGLGPAARPPARRGRPLARRRERWRSSCARPSTTSRSAAAAPASTCGCCPAEDFPKLPGRAAASR